MTEPESLPKPRIQSTEEIKQTTKRVGSLRPQKPKRWRIIGIVGIVGLCIASSTLTAWLLIGTGIIKPDASKTITENRDTLVLQEGEIVTDVFKRVNPSVVSITTISTAARGPFGTAALRQGDGSGIIISKNGYILTNKHVVPEGVSKVTVILADGKEYNDVSVVGRDPSNDIAFLKIQGVDNLPEAVIGDSNVVEPGQKVVAIGNALGEFRNSVTSGIISGLGRPIQADDGTTSEKLENLFQTDAAINPGNSGGPLLNLKGEVIGVNTAVAEQAQGIGFAIPINDAKGMIDSVKKQGKIVKPYLGVKFVGLTKEMARQLSQTTTSGAYILNNGVMPDSPADKAGLKERDIIKKVNNKEVTEQSTLSSLLAQHSPGEKLTLIIVRDGKEQTVSVTLEAYPNM